MCLKLFTYAKSRFFHDDARIECIFFFLFSVTDVLYEGCFPDYEVTVNFMYEDVTSMTVESCFVACGGSGYDNVGMQVFSFSRLFYLPPVISHA